MVPRSLRSGLCAALLAVAGLLHLGCSSGSSNPPGDPAPSPIISFVSSAQTINPGDTVSLSWIVQDGYTVTVTAAAGAGKEAAAKVVAGPQAANVTGFQQVTPAGTTTYTLTATGSAGTLTKKITIVVAPAIGIIAPTYVTASQAGYTASVASQSGATYAWTLTGGTITAGSGTRSVTFTPGSSGSVALSVDVTAPSGTANSRATCTIVPTPVATLTTPGFAGAGQVGISASVPVQSGVAYLWSLTNGTPTAGVGTANLTYTAGSTGTVGLSVQVVNQAGTIATGTANAPIIGPPDATVTAPAVASAGRSGYTASVPAQAGMTYQWNVSGAAIDSGSATSTITFTPFGNGTVTFTAVVTNPAGVSRTGNASTAIAAIPFSSISAPAYVVTTQAGYTATVSPLPAGYTVAWTSGDSTITGGATTATSTFTAGTGLTTTLTATITDPAGTTYPFTKTLPVAPYPLTPWGYAKTLTLTHAGASALTNTFILVSLDTATLIGATKLRADGQDLRFFASPIQECAYWIQSGLNTSSTLVWVKIPSIPVGTSTVTMTYGNAVATHTNAPGNLFGANLAALYTFTEGSGTTVHDWVGGFDLTATGLTWVAGPQAGVGGLSGFSNGGGGNSLKAAGMGPALTNGDFTIIMMAKPDAASSTGSVRGLMGTYTNDGSSGWQLKTQGGAGQFMLITNQGGSWCQSAAGTFTANNWHLYGARRVAAPAVGATNSLFLNGVFRVNICANDSRNVDNAGAFLEMGRGYSGIFSLTGPVSMAAIYTRALSDTEMANLSAGLQPNPAPTTVQGAEGTSFVLPTP